MLSLKYSFICMVICAWSLAGPAWAGPLERVTALPGDTDLIRAEIISRLEGYDAVWQTARQRSAEMSALPAWNKVQSFGETLDNIRDWLKEGDFTRAYDQVLDYGLVQDAAFLENAVVMAMPFLVIGPFGEESFTDLSGPARWIMSGGEALLQQAYLGEFDTQPKSLDYLANRSFRPDTSIKYQSFQAQPVSWAPAWKTDILPLADFTPPDGMWSVVYAYARVYSPERYPAALVIGGNTPGLLGWVNNRLWVYQPNIEGERTTVAVSQGGFVLGKGWNTLLFKILARNDTFLTLRFVHNQRRSEIINDLEFKIFNQSGETLSEE